MRLFPFSAIVGQDLLKKGLLVNAVDPSIGGVLIRGEKGTGKTTGTCVRVGSPHEGVGLGLPVRMSSRRFSLQGVRGAVVLR
ncbi:MAG: hypothetical protein E4H29_05575 [Deltaproteobacteria bacterium]|nr:MAG: hypothetical protein E4H29_05575 [Deltaproteobacteria bacterium]